VTISPTGVVTNLGASGQSIDAIAFVPGDAADGSKFAEFGK
jgi:hypothetical protein